MSNRESQTGKFYMGNRSNANAELLLPENQILIMAEKQRREKEAEELKKLHLEAQETKQREIEERLATLELLPMFDKVIILEYPENPYRKLIQNGLIIDYTGDFQNPDSGEKDKLQTFIGCAKIIEVGPLAKYLKPGDDVFYDTRTIYPVPFMSMGYKLTSETQILCVLNENLKERFKINE